MVISNPKKKDPWVTKSTPHTLRIKSWIRVFIIFRWKIHSILQKIVLLFTYEERQTSELSALLKTKESQRERAIADQSVKQTFSSTKCYFIKIILQNVVPEGPFHSSTLPDITVI